MPLIRTHRGLQYVSDEQASTISASARVRPEPEERPKALVGMSGFFASTKDYLPWILAACQLVSWFSFKYLTSDRAAQQQSDDHAAILEIKSTLGKVTAEQASLTGKLDTVNGKVDLLVNFNLKSK